MTIREAFAASETMGIYTVHLGDMIHIDLIGGSGDATISVYDERTRKPVAPEWTLPLTTIERIFLPLDWKPTPLADE